MKRFLFTKKCLFFFIFLACLTKAKAYDFSAVCESGQTLYYTILNDHEVALVEPRLPGYTAPWGGYTKPEGDLVIPETVNNEGTTYTVVVLGDNALAECQGLTSVMLPPSIRRIEAEAFVFCHNLHCAMVIPDQCTFIGCYAFWECYSLTSLTLGASVDTIQYSAFEDCTGLQFIQCNTPTPPFAQHLPSNPYYEDRSIFNNVPTDIPVEVNCLTIEQFQMEWDWNRFTNMTGVYLGAPSLMVEVNNPDFGTAEVVVLPAGCDDALATVRAIPNAGHVFCYWKRNGVPVSFDAEYTFTLDHHCVLTACFDSFVTVYDSIAYPDHVVGRYFNNAGQVTSTTASDFTYGANGRLTSYSCSNLVSSTFAFIEYPTMPSYIHSFYPGHPVEEETLSFTYEDRQIKHFEHRRWSDYDESFHYFQDYDYDKHFLIRMDKTLPEMNYTHRHSYTYDNGHKTRIDNYYKGYGDDLKLSTSTKNLYDERLQLLTSETETYDDAGAVVSRTKTVYDYNSQNKTEDIFIQTFDFDNGIWMNTKRTHFIYDFKSRLVECQTSIWSTDEADWDITKKVIYAFNDETQTLTVSFRKKVNGQWVWDVFTDQSLFNDPNLAEWQRTLANVYGGVGQLEISLHYDMVETAFPLLSEWYYKIETDEGNVTYQHLEYTNDTTINDEPRIKVVVRTNQIYDKSGQVQQTHEYIMERDSKVYWWNKDLQEFTVLYDYLAEPGEGWEIKVGLESIAVHVDSIGNFEYQGEVHRVLHVSDANGVFNGDIVVGLGHLTSFFPEKLMRNATRMNVEGLRCYWVGEALLYHQGEDCDAVYYHFHEVDEDEQCGVRVYPNPADDILRVEMSHQEGAFGEFRITNLLGQTVMTGRISGETIDVSALSQGMYFLTIDGQSFKIMKR